MSKSTADGNGNEVALIVVLFHPDEESIAHIEGLAGVGHKVIAVSNGITSQQRARMFGVKGIILVDNLKNVGLAGALNQGIERFLASEGSSVILLDQDSRVSADMIELLKKCADRLRETNRRVGCVAPRLVDMKAPEASVGAPGEPLTVATSGSLLTREALLEVGLMWEELFIDGIDHEWCFRARAKGFLVVVEPSATLSHQMGDAGVRIGDRFRPIHRSPFRHYHIVRNTLWLQRCRYIPLKWRVRELTKLVYRAPIYFLVSSNRSETFRALIRGLLNGIATPPRMPAVAL